MPFRVASGVIGLFFLLQGIHWIVDPGGAAEGLGMTLLDGIGRSSQIGDTGGFFVSLGTMSLLGAYRSNGQWLRGGALMLGSVAAIRTLAWLMHDAEFAAVFIGVEVVVAGLLLFVASRIEGTIASAEPKA